MISQNEPHEYPDLYQRIQEALKSPNLSKEDKRVLSYLYGSGLMYLAAAKLLLEDEGM
jgi:hypothetical protein